MKTLTNIQQNRRRYKLHQLIKGLYAYKPKQRTVYVTNENCIENRFLLELKEKFNYQIQFEIS